MQAPPPPDLNFIAPMVVTIVFFVTTGAVLIFRPLTKRLGDRLAREKQLPPPAVDPDELVHLRQVLEETSARLERLEERVEFTERLLSSPRPAGELAGPTSGSPR